MERVKAVCADKLGTHPEELQTEWEYVVSTRVLMLNRLANQHIANHAGDTKSANTDPEPDPNFPNRNHDHNADPDHNQP